MSNTSTTNGGPAIVNLDSGDFGLDVAILAALAESDDDFDRAIGESGKAAFDRAIETGEPVKSALGMARLAMHQARDGMA